MPSNTGMSKFRFDLKAKRFERELVKLSRRIADLGVEETHRNFDMQAFAGKRWEKSARPQNHPLLNKTGRMRNSVRVLRADKARIKWGATVDYAKYHNAGTKYIPQRRFVGMTPRLRRLIKREISFTFRRSMRK